MRTIPSSFYSPGLGTPSWGIYIYLHILTSLTNMLRRNFFWKLRDFVEFYFILVIASNVPPCFLNFNFFGRNSWWQNTVGPIAGKACRERGGQRRHQLVWMQQKSVPSYSRKTPWRMSGAKRRTGGKAGKRLRRGQQKSYWLLQDGNQQGNTGNVNWSEETGKTQCTDNQEQS